MITPWRILHSSNNFGSLITGTITEIVFWQQINKAHRILTSSPFFLIWEDVLFPLALQCGNGPKFWKILGRLCESVITRVAYFHSTPVHTFLCVWPQACTVMRTSPQGAVVSYQSEQWCSSARGPSCRLQVTEIHSPETLE